MVLCNILDQTKIRHLLKPKENRVYKGKLTIVMRLDFQLVTQSIEEFSQEEYEFNYYRELRVLRFYKLHLRKINQTIFLKNFFCIKAWV